MADNVSVRRGPPAPCKGEYAGYMISGTSVSCHLVCLSSSTCKSGALIKLPVAVGRSLLLDVCTPLIHSSMFVRPRYRANAYMHIYAFCCPHQVCDMSMTIVIAGRCSMYTRLSLCGYRAGLPNRERLSGCLESTFWLLEQLRHSIVCATSSLWH